MADARRIITILALGILYTLFANFTIEAVLERPEYQDFCPDQGKYMARPVVSGTCDIMPYDEQMARECQGHIAYNYNESGCETEAYCEPCSYLYQQAEQKYNLNVFIASSLFGIAALAFGLWMPLAANVVNEWIGSGLVLGGMGAILTGTARYFGDMGRYVRPLVLLAELILVIFLAYRKFGGSKAEARPDEKAEEKTSARIESKPARRVRRK